ncbi:MAG: DEAD/DEAH box helicase [Candidatus ainarchaeum sp.]|nr:DEAD/DEAH box helicase [Candidatus ainarchaeum sp.]
MKFEEFGLKPELLEQIKQIGFTSPTEIQEKCVPLILKGRDVVGHSQTGSGKTAAFALPIINLIEQGKNLQVLVLAPTRELAQQVKETFESFSEKLGFRTTSIYGGVGFGAQVSGVQRSEIIVATPGRLIDHLDRGTINLRNIKFVVLDEVDRMLDIGFEKDVNKILSKVPKERQTVMFSATMPIAAKKIAQTYLNNPINIQAETKVDTSLLNQIAYHVPKEKRFSLLLHLIKEKNGTALVFCRTKRDVDKVTKNLRKQGLSVAGVHGDITQTQRQYAVKNFKDNKLDVLIATDVASRGLDIKNVTHVYNYEIPDEVDDYTHRIGRTARAGKSGTAITFVTERDKRTFSFITRVHEIKIEPTPDFPQVSFLKSEPERDRQGFGRGRSFSDDKPRFDRTEKSFGRSKPRFNKERTFSDDKPRFDRTKKSFGRSKPGFNKERTFSDDKPSQYSKRPSRPFKTNTRNANFDYLNKESKPRTAYASKGKFGQNKERYTPKTDGEITDYKKKFGPKTSSFKTKSKDSKPRSTAKKTDEKFWKTKRYGKKSTR